MNSARNLRVLGSCRIALVLLVIACAAPRIFAQEKKPAAPEEAIASDALADRAITTYQARFRYWRNEDTRLANEAIDGKVRAELPGILKADAAAVKAILDTEAPRLAAAPGTPIEQKLGALFVMGRYEAVIEDGEKHSALLPAASCRTMGDAARAIFRKTPDRKHIDGAKSYYTMAVFAVDHLKAPGEWADIAQDAALASFALGVYRDAEPLWRAAAVIRKREDGEKSPAYAYALNGLAGTMQMMNQLGEAELLYRSVLAIYEVTYGEKHPKVGEVLNNLAVLLQADTRVAEADVFMQRAV